MPTLSNLNKQVKAIEDKAERIGDTVGFTGNLADNVQDDLADIRTVRGKLEQLIVKLQQFLLFLPKEAKLVEQRLELRKKQ